VTTHDHWRWPHRGWNAYGLLKKQMCRKLFSNSIIEAFLYYRHTELETESTIKEFGNTSIRRNEERWEAYSWSRRQRGLRLRAWPLGCWDRGFETRWGHGCLSLVFSCVGSGPSDELNPCQKESRTKIQKPKKGASENTDRRSIQKKKKKKSLRRIVEAITRVAMKLSPCRDANSKYMELY
jgi:hypothetical protein